MKLGTEQFESLMLEQMDTLYRLARRLTGDEQRSADLVQETCLRALRSKESFDLQEFGIRPWLVRIMHNLHFSRGERESRQPQATDTEQLDAAGDGQANSSLPPIDPASFEAMDERVVAALESLPAEHKSIMLLWAVEDFSYKEIAAALDIPIGTVMSRLHRARQKLSDQLRTMATQEGIVRK
jgi:RNA polymerase sigma-70 factor (ECF subfamily)